MLTPDAGMARPAAMKHAAVRRLLGGAALLLVAACMGRVGLSKFFSLNAWEDACQVGLFGEKDIPRRAPPADFRHRCFADEFGTPDVQKLSN